MAEIRGPHDAFFKQTFSRPEMAGALLRHYASADVVARLDLDSLQLAKDSFVDPDLQEAYSDLLFSARLLDGGSAFLYVLLEHKRRVERAVPLQLLGYVVRIWQRCEQERRPLPAVFPVVIYHGRAPWSAPRRMHDLVDLAEPSLLRFVPDLSYDLIDLSHLEDEDIRGAILLRVAVFTLGAIAREDLRERLPGLRALLSELALAQTGIDYIRTVLTYLAKATDRERIPREALHALVEGLPGVEGVMATIADEWIEEGVRKGIEKGLEQGLEKGLEQGLEKGLRLAVVRVLESRFGPLSPEHAAALEQVADVESLDRLLRQAIGAQSLAQFAGSLPGSTS